MQGIFPETEFHQKARAVLCRRPWMSLRALDPDESAHVGKRRGLASAKSTKLQDNGLESWKRWSEFQDVVICATGIRSLE